MRPTFSGVLISGRKLAQRFSPSENAMLASTTSASASQMSPGPAKYSAIVATAQATAAVIKNRFFRADTSASAPINGASTSTTTCDTASAVPHQPGARTSPSATTPVKYTA